MDSPARTRRSNQHKPCPPDHILRPIVEELSETMRRPEMLELMIQERLFDTDKYGLCLRTLLTRCQKWGLKGTKSYKHTMDTVEPYVEAVRERFPNMGARLMKRTISQEHGQKVPIKAIQGYLTANHPDEVEARRHGRFKRKQFYAAGINDFWMFDQHDKWRKFHLYLHSGLEPVSGKILWLKIWWTNRNPSLVCSYYLDAVEETGGTALITQSDLGTENNGIANAHTRIRHKLDPSLSGTLQHRWMTDHMNIKPEAFWSQLRSQWSYGFEDVISDGVRYGRYDPAEPLEKLVFQWVFIPWLQAELDHFRTRYNTTKKRKNNKSLLPHGQPDIIFKHPNFYKVRDYKVIIDQQTLSDTRNEFAPPDHPVFRLSPPHFAHLASQFYFALGEPIITRETVWQIFTALLLRFREVEEGDHELAAEILGIEVAPPVEANPEDFMAVHPFQPFRMGDPVIGGQPDGGNMGNRDARATDDMVDELSDDGNPDDRLFMIFSSDEEDEGGNEDN